MKTEAEWVEDVKRLLRVEMTRRGVTYEQLSEKLATIGVTELSGEHSEQGCARQIHGHVSRSMPYGVKSALTSSHR